MKISEYYDLPGFDPNNLSEAKIKHYIDIIKQKYITYCQHTIHHSKKLQFSSLFKHDYKISSYLDLIRNSANRKDLVKIRTSNHKLMIEIGRNNQTSSNDRFCPICNSGITEDEFHFLFHYPKTQSQGRNSTIKSNKILSTLISYLSHYVMIYLIICYQIMLMTLD